MAVNSTAIWRTRPGGSNTNGGGYDPGIAGAATDYSQQNSAQASGTHGTAAGTATFTDSTAVAFTPAMIGNALYLTGTGFTTGWYFVVGYTSTSVVTLDRSPGTGTATGTWYLGGGWADFWTNTTSSGPLVPGNWCYILGSGTPNPASYSYDYSPSTYFAPASGNTTAGNITFANDPSTPGYIAPPNTTGGMPCISHTGQLFTSASPNFWAYVNFVGLYFVCTAATNTNGVIYQAGSNSTCLIFGCVSDENGHDVDNFKNSGNSYIFAVIGCEVFSSSGGSGGSNHAVIAPTTMTGCNIHDCVGAPGNFLGAPSFVSGNVFAKNNGAIYISNGGSYPVTFINNTIDGTIGADGIAYANQASLSASVVMNNIFSNIAGSGKYAQNVGAGTGTQNTQVKNFNDYNVYYNNRANLNNLNYGPHDTQEATNPYVGQSTENYTLA